MKKCPFCAEEIKDEAVKCRHCGSILKQSTLKKKITCSGCLIVFLVLVGLAIIIPNMIGPGEKKTIQQSAPIHQPASTHQSTLPSQYREFVVIDSAAPSAGFRSYPGGEDEKLGRIPAGTKVEVFGKKEWMIGRGRAKIKQVWYKVKYKNETGWISQYVTVGPGKIIKEPIKEKPISEWDGLKIGSTLKQVKEKIISLNGISKGIDGNYIEIVSGTKNKYRYWIQRSPTLNSEVVLTLKDDKLITIQNTYGEADIRNITRANTTYNRLIKDFSNRWGKPAKSSNIKTIWLRKNVVAELYLEKPQNQYAYPNLILTIYLK